MQHKMKLQSQPFNQIKNKTKVIEMRLYDEKRQLLNIDDEIEFTNIDNSEIINVKIKNLHHFDNFQELYNSFDKISLEYEKDESANPTDMEQYYKKEDIEKYGVVGIEINVID